MKISRLRLSTVLCATFTLGFGGCLFLDPESEAQLGVTSARWVIKDSVLVYNVLDRPLLGKDTWAAPRMRFFQVRVNSSRKFYGNELLFEVDSALSCGDMRVQDSLVFASYDYRPEVSNKIQITCPESGHGAGMIVGRLGTTPFSPLPAAADTASLRAVWGAYNEDFRLKHHDEGFVVLGGTMSAGTVCLDHGPCLEDLVKAWDAAHP